MVKVHPFSSFCFGRGSVEEPWKNSRFAVVILKDGKVQAIIAFEQEMNCTEEKMEFSELF